MRSHSVNLIHPVDEIFCFYNRTTNFYDLKSELYTSVALKTLVL